MDTCPSARAYSTEDVTTKMYIHHIINRNHTAHNMAIGSWRIKAAMQWIDRAVKLKALGNTCNSTSNQVQIKQNKHIAAWP